LAVFLLTSLAIKNTKSVQLAVIAANFMMGGEIVVLTQRTNRFEPARACFALPVLRGRLRRNAYAGIDSWIVGMVANRDDRISTMQLVGS